ncbi:MAG: ATP-dependent Clp protease proteolytic subunit [bacterium]
MANNDIYTGLLDRKVLAVAGEVNGDMLKYFRNSMAELYCKGCPDIMIIFSSNGGEVITGLDIYDLIVTYPGKKTGIVTGLAASIAAVILQACDKRFATHHARVLIHHINTRRVGLDTLRDDSKIAELRKDLEQSQAHLYEILCKKTNKTREVISEECVKNREMMAAEAVQFGLLDGEWDKPLPFTGS